MSSNTSFSFVLDKKVALLFLMVVIISIVITALPIYLMHYISTNASLMLMVCIEFILALVVCLFFFRQSLRLKSNKSRKSVYLSGVALLLVQIIYYFLHVKDVSPAFFSPFEIFSLVILVPFYEEVIYRGCLFELSSYITNSTPVASLITSLIFSLMHAQYNSIGAHGVMFFISMVLVYIRIRTNGLLYSMLLHAIMNAMIIVLSSQMLFR